MKFKPLIRHLRPRHLWNHRRGLCTVCGKKTVFFLIGTPETIRNHAVCIRCLSCSRHRHLAKCILEEFHDRGLTRLSDFSKSPDIQIYNASHSGYIVEAMGWGRNIVHSEYFDNIQPGESKNGVLCQDLQRLTFQDKTFDLILSEDVFEHLEDYRAGFKEVYRVLKKGGKHIFTVPFYFDRRTKDLFERKDNKTVLIEPIEYHGDPIRGQIPCYTHFGYDLFDFLREIGFETNLNISTFKDEIRFGTFESYTFVTNKN